MPKGCDKDAGDDEDDGWGDDGMEIFFRIIFPWNRTIFDFKIDLKNCATSQKKLGVHVTDTEKVQIRF